MSACQRFRIKPNRGTSSTLILWGDEKMRKRKDINPTIITDFYYFK